MTASYRAMEVLDRGGVFAPRWSMWDDAVVLTPNGAAVTHTIVADANLQKPAFVSFSGNGDFYVKFNATATVPGSHITDGSAAILNPAVRYIADVTSISLISPTGGATVVTMEFWGP